MKPPPEQFKLLVEAMASQFNREPTEALIVGYWMGLDDLEVQEIAAAVQHCLRTSKFMPTVAELREAIEGNLDDQAELAFDTFSRNVSYYDSLNFEDPAINATVRHLGGVDRVCDMATDGQEFNVFYKQEFLKVYQMYCRRGVSEEAGSTLVGFYDSQNRERERVLQIGCCYSRKPLPQIGTTVGLLELPSV